MNEPISRQINKLVAAGRVAEAHALAEEAHRAYPKIKLYEELARACESPRPKTTNKPVQQLPVQNLKRKKSTTDLESLEYHLRKKLEKVRTREISAIKAWNDISFLAPESWPRDPRLSKIIGPTATSLDLLKQQGKDAILIMAGDVTGGAGIAALRIHECLNSIGQKADIIYRDHNVIRIKQCCNAPVELETEDLTPRIYEGFDPLIIEEMRDHIANEVHLAMSLKGPGSNTFLFHSEESLDIREIAKLYKAVNIHWTDFLLTSTSLERIRDVEIPITITLHDMYWLSGSCHYSAGCTQFQDACTSCPLITTTSETIELFNRYHNATLGSLKDLTVISPSQWLCNLAGKSTALSSRQIYLIPNPQANKAHAIANKDYQDDDKPITIIYGALGLEEKRKGYILFTSICKELKEKNSNIRFKVFGSMSDDQVKELNLYSCDVLGFLSQPELTNQLKESDAMLIISYEDNYPNLCVEAAALGLPILASDNSGLRSFVNASSGGILVSNSPLEIANVIVGLTREKLKKLSLNILKWHKKQHSTTELEEAYRAVILRSFGHEKYIHMPSNKKTNEGIDQCQISSLSLSSYVERASDYGIEILVPPNKYENNTYTLSYTTQETGMPPLDLYIGGFRHDKEPALNSDNRTFTLTNLPAGKPAKLIRSDSTSKYYYNHLSISSINIYPDELVNSSIQRPIEPASNSVDNSSEFKMIICDDSLVFESYNNLKVYWLLSNQRYSLHFINPPSPNQSTNSNRDESHNMIIEFHALNLRHNPVEEVRLEINTSSESIQVPPSIVDSKFFFCINSSIFNTMTSIFLATGAGELLEDGRSVVALVSHHAAFVK